jgi:PEP-CTERM motif
MNKSILSFLSFFVFAAFLSASPVSVSFVSGGNPEVIAYGADIGPYTLSVDGQITAAMCMDDFLEVGGSWTANQTAVNGLDFSNTYLGNSTFTIGGFTVTSGQIYSAEAYLFSLLTQPGADRANIQEAAWAIMNPNTLANIINTSNTQVENYLLLAASNYSTFDTSGFQILSQVNPGASLQQEFMIYSPLADAPEPATFALFGAGLFIAYTATRLARRNKLAATKS